MILRFVFILALLIAVDVTIVVLVVKSPGAIPPVAVAAVALGAVPLIAMAAFHMLWRPMLGQFDRQQPSLDAVRRRYQSFSIGIVNMGFSIHVAVDDEFLHLEPLWPWQVLGAMPVSIPWSALSPAPRDAINLFGRAVRVNGHTLVGPKWCLERVPQAPR
ncbi:MAG: hypothetical protein FJ253_07995 [Phycisphaerae bacterium]|nr:hypothetical protein [Phycisphaerae bacterium]